MTDHPCKGLRKNQRDVFEQIAVGNALPATPQRNLDILEERGLIQRAGNKTLGRDALGTITIPQYYVPLSIHAQWCEWCSEQPDLAITAGHSTGRGEP
jgi:hypothetical protein